jgi:mannose-6-phosphate isomerase-like protein (cupin superfamily)
VRVKIGSSNDATGKGWFAGPWNSAISVAVGFADLGVDDPHTHEATHEVYLVARGTSTALVNGVEVDLVLGDMLIVEPGEAHTFTSSSSDDLHFVVQAPFVADGKRSP